MPALPFPPHCGPRLHIPIPVSLCFPGAAPSHSHCGPAVSEELVCLTDPHPWGIAPSISKRQTCTWNTISFCFKWAESLRGHPTPPGENKQALPPSPWPLPLWDNVPPIQGHRYTVCCATLLRLPLPPTHLCMAGKCCVATRVLCLSCVPKAGSRRGTQWWYLEKGKSFEHKHP